MEQTLTERGIERRIKRYLRAEPQQFFLNCTPGFETFLATEIFGITGEHPSQIISGGCLVSGALDSVYPLNIQSTIATRVLLRVAEFKVKSYPELYDKIQRISWELYLTTMTHFMVDVTAKTSRLHHSDNIANSVTEAIHTYFSKYPLPTVKGNKKLNFQAIYLRLHDDICTISMDTSGDPLYKRGYKLDVGVAPIRENIASGMLAFCDFSLYQTVWDPFCGSGTFLFELMMKYVKSNRMFSRRFGLEFAPWFQESKLQKVRHTVDIELPFQLIGSDIEISTISKNMKSFNDAPISIIEVDAKEIRPKKAEKGLIITNPPYGLRVRTEGNSILKEMGAFFRNASENFKGWDMMMVVPIDWKLPKAVGEWKEVLTYSHGGLDVKVVFTTII